MTLADTKAAKLRIPYLGPEPPPSRPVRWMVQVASAVTAMLYVVRGALYLQRANLDRQGLDHPFNISNLADQLTANQSLVNVANRLGLLAVAILVVTDIVWRFKRRPPEIKRRLGEAYVESPVVWVVPAWYRVVGGVLVGAAVFASISGTVTITTKAADLPGHRALTALSSILLAGLWVLFILVPRWADRVHDERMAWSGPYREVPTTVPYFPPLSALTQGGGSSVASGSGGGTSVGQPEGPMWFLTTAGLILLLFVAVITGIASIGDLLSPRGNAAVDLAWFAGVCAALALVVLVFVRRYRRNHPNADALAEPEGQWYG